MQCTRQVGHTAGVAWHGRAYLSRVTGALFRCNRALSAAMCGWTVATVRGKLLRRVVARLRTALGGPCPCNRVHLLVRLPHNHTGWFVCLRRRLPGTP